MGAFNITQLSLQKIVFYTSVTSLILSVILIIGYLINLSFPFFGSGKINLLLGLSLIYTSFLLLHLFLIKNEHTQNISLSISSYLFTFTSLFLVFDSIYPSLLKVSILFKEVIILTSLFSLIFILLFVVIYDKSSKGIRLNFVYNYKLILIIIIVVSFLTRIILATKVPLHIDESYTHLVTLGLFKFGEIGVTESGIYYERTIIYNFLNSISYYLFDNIYLQLRFLNIILFSFCLPIIFFTIKKITENIELALFTTFLVSTNWYLILISLMARSYTVSILLICISCYLLALIYKTSSTKKQWVYMFCLVGVLCLNYLEGINLGVYHMLPLLGILSLIYFFYASKFNKLLFLIFTVTCSSSLMFYIIFIKPTVFTMIVSYLKPSFAVEQVLNISSLYSYFNLIGTLLVISTLFVSIFLYSKFRYLSIIAFWIVCIVFFQGFLYGQKSFDFRYFYSLIIPLTFLVSFFTLYLIKSKRLYRISGGFILFTILCTSIFNISNLYKGTLDWRIQTPQNWGFMLNQIPPNSIVITDYPIVLQTLRNDLTIYKMSYHPLENEVLDKELRVERLKQNFTSTEINNFFDFVDLKTVNHQVTTNQEFDIYTGSPKIMSEDHLLDILDTNKQVFTLFTYDVPKHKNRYPEIYSIFLQGKTISVQNSVKNVYDDRQHPFIETLKLVRLN